MEIKELESALEGVLFAAGEPVSVERLCLGLEVDRPTLDAVAQQLMDKYSYDRRGIRLLRLDTSYQLCSAPEFAPYVRKTLESRKPARLSQPALEVLAIIAYYQPVTRAYVDQVRGVDSSYTMGLLLERELIEEAGRLAVPGRPMQFKTTKNFLRSFGLSSLEELPELPNQTQEGSQLTLELEASLARLRESEGAEDAPEQPPEPPAEGDVRALYILAAVVLSLFLIGQIRVGGRAEFNAEGFFLWVRLGKIKIKILPMKPKEERPKKAQKSKAEKGAQEAQKEKPSVSLPEKIGGALEYAQALLPVALEAAGGLWRGLRVDTLELELTAGGDDPADAAMLYGQANAALGALWYPLTKAFKVKDGRARVVLDFDAPGTTVYGTAALSIKIGTAVWIGLRAGVKALFGALAAKKRIKIKRQQRKAA